MKKTFPKKQLLAAFKDAGEVFKQCARKSKLLSALAWKPEVAADFFQNKQTELPKPTYSVDRKTCLDLLDQLSALKPKLRGDHPVLGWLEKMRESFENGTRMMLEIEN